MESIKNWLSELQIDFVGKRKIAATGSAILATLSVVLFFFPGPNWGIDFTGGTELHLGFEEPVSIGEMRDALSDLGLPSDAVQEVGDDAASPEFKVRIKDDRFGADELEAEVTEGLEAAFGTDWIQEMQFSAEVGTRVSVIHKEGVQTDVEAIQEAVSSIEGVSAELGTEDREVVLKFPGLSRVIERKIRSVVGDRAFEVLSIDAVGPKVGGELRTQGFMSLAATLGLVLLYVAFRFDVAFAPGAIVALIHDVVLTVGVFILLGKEFNLSIVGALLTIVGYSLNDTIVIYDRIRENQTRFRRDDLPGLINQSINETLARTVATSFTTFLAIVPFLFLSGSVIADFALAMVLGIIFGTYSTVFVASPMIIFMEKIKPALAKLVAVDVKDELADFEAAEGVPETESARRRAERARLEREAGDSDRS